MFRERFIEIADNALQQGAAFSLAAVMQQLFFTSAPHNPVQYGDDDEEDETGSGKTHHSTNFNHESISQDRTISELIFNIDLKPQSIPQPTLVVWGRLDSTHKSTNKGSIVDYIQKRGLQYVELDGCGHHPELQQPKVFASMLKNFIFKENGIT